MTLRRIDVAMKISYILVSINVYVHKTEDGGHDAMIHVGPAIYGD